MHKAPEDEEAIWADVKQVAEKAVDAFIQMRETEGQRLYEDVMSRAETILNIVGRLKSALGDRHGIPRASGSKAAARY